MSGWRRVGAAVGAAAALYTGLVLASRTGFVRNRLVSLASRSTGYEVRIGTAGLDWGLDPHVGDVAVSAASREPFLTADSIDGRSVFRGLIGRGSARVSITAPRIRLAAWAPPRRSETERSGQGPLSLPSWIGRVDVREGFIEGGPQRTAAIGPIDASASSIEASTDLRLAGTSALPGAAGRVVWSAQVAPGGQPIAAKLEIGVVRLGRLADEVGIHLPSPLGEGKAAIDVELHGAMGAPLAVAARGSAKLGSTTSPFTLEASGSIDLGSGRLTFAAEARAQAASQPIGVGPSEVRVDKVSLEGDAVLSEGTTRAKILVAGFGWKEPEGALLAEEITVHGNLALGPGDAREHSLRFDVRADGGELLVANRYYLGLTDVPIAIAGLARAVSGGVALSNGRISASGVGSASVSASWTGGDAAGPAPAPDAAATARRRAEVKLDLRDVARAFALAVRDPWQEAFPILSGTDVRGSVTGALRVERSGTERESLAGRLLWRGSASVASPDVQVGEISLDLPLSIGTQPEAAESTGIVKLGDVAVGGVGVGPIELPLTASPDRLALSHSSRIAALDGEIVLTELSATGLASAARELAFGLRASGLRLAPIATALGLPAFGGVISAELPKARLAGGELETKGEIVMQVFGGTVRLQRLRASEIGSGVATFSTDATFEDISLGKLTEVLDIGHISGVARGGVEGLQVQAGMPIRFTAWLESITRSGVPQRISVDAIRKLSILGGSGGDPFSQGVLSLFDEYRYAKIGFRCALDGDRLTVEGIEQRDGKDYLVIGSVLPPRVDVVSHTRTVAFSEMVSRLGRAIESEGPRVE